MRLIIALFQAPVLSCWYVVAVERALVQASVAICVRREVVRGWDGVSEGFGLGRGGLEGGCFVLGCNGKDVRRLRLWTWLRLGLWVFCCGIEIFRL
jgi:hypothetical protein